jgi:hypothetical protein
VSSVFLQVIDLGRVVGLVSYLVNSKNRQRRTAGGLSAAAAKCAAFGRDDECWVESEGRVTARATATATARARATATARTNGKGKSNSKGNGKGKDKGKDKGRTQRTLRKSREGRRGVSRAFGWLIGGREKYGVLREEQNDKIKGRCG